MKKMYKEYLLKNHNFDKKTMLGIFSLIIVISGIFGWCYEVIFYYFNSGMKEIYFRGGNFLPWINIYAIGAIIIYLLTYNKRRNPLLVFLTSMISTGILEYFAGYFMEYIMGIKCWDYSKEILSFFNINGYVCLRSILLFSVSGLLLIYLVVPFCFYLAKKMKKKYFLILSYSLCSIFLFDELYNLLFARILSLPRASDIYKKLGLKYLYFK